MSKLPSVETCTSISGNVDTSVVGIFLNSKDWSKGLPKESPKESPKGSIEKLKKSGVFTGKYGSLQFLRFANSLGSSPSENLLLLGFGESAQLSEEKYRKAGAYVWAKLASEKVKTAVV